MKERKEEKRPRQEAPDLQKPENTDVSENWAEETIADLDDFIESQGIYIRQ